MINQCTRSIFTGSKLSCEERARRAGITQNARAHRRFARLSLSASRLHPGYLQLLVESFSRVSARGWEATSECFSWKKIPSLVPTTRCLGSYIACKAKSKWTPFVIKVKWYVSRSSAPEAPRTKVQLSLHSHYAISKSVVVLPSHALSARAARIAHLERLAKSCATTNSIMKTLMNRSLCIRATSIIVCNSSSGVSAFIETSNPRVFYTILWLEENLRSENSILWANC